MLYVCLSKIVFIKEVSLLFPSVNMYKMISLWAKNSIINYRNIAVDKCKTWLELFTLILLGSLKFICMNIIDKLKCLKTE